MSVLTTVLIAIAAAFIGFIIGNYIADYDVGWVPYTEPPKNPVKTFNAEPPPCPAVTSKVVLPKRISKAEYNKRVDACLKDAVTKAVNVYVAVSDKSAKRRIIKSMYDEWNDKLCDNLAYSKYNSEFPRLDIIGRKISSDKSGYRPYSIRFDAVWGVKLPSDIVTYARRHK